MFKNTIKYGLIFAVAFLTSENVLAQQKITEGTLSITYAVDSFRISKKNAYEDVKISFKDDYLKLNSSYTFFNKPNETCMIYRFSKPDMLFLSEISGLKLAVNLSQTYYEDILSGTYGSRRVSDKMELLNASLIDFQSTGQKEQVSGYLCEKYTADMPGGEKLMVWATEDMILPFNFLKYEIGTLSELLKGKKIKGTLLRLQYGNKLNATVKLDTQKVADISMEVPVGYYVFDINQVMAGFATKPKNK